MTRATPADLPSLTGLRAVAAFWVLGYHALGFVAAGPPVLRHGYLGVDLFFLLSGYVLTHVYAADFAARGLRAHPAFLWRRVARLWPLWLVVLVLFAAKYAVGRWSGLGGGGAHTLADPGLWATYALMMQSWGWVDPEAIDPPAWSLSLEWAAYLAFPLFLAAAAPFRRPLWILAALAAVLAAYFWLTDALQMGRVWEDVATSRPRLIAEFFAGVLLRRLADVAPVDERAAGYALFAAFAALIALLVAAPHLLWVDHVSIVVLAAIVFLAGVARGPLAHPLARTLGEASYALYVSHWLAFEIFWHLIHRHGGTVGGMRGIAAAAGFVLGAVALALLLHVAVERPARSALRRLAE